MEQADWKAFPKRLEQSKAGGKIRGIGMATYIEACAFPGSEPAFVELNGDGTVTLKIGTQTNGQGHATAYAQFVVEKLNLDIDKIHVRQGDTDELEGRRRHRRLALHPARRRVGFARGRGSGRTRSSASPPTSWRPRPATSNCPTASPASSAPTARSTLPSIAKAAKNPDDLKGFGEFVQDEAPIRTAPISARSRSIRRPA